MIQANPIQQVNPQVPVAVVEALSAPWTELATVAQQINQI